MLKDVTDALIDWQESRVQSSTVKYLKQKQDDK